jgi:hypothetical protein
MMMLGLYCTSRQQNIDQPKDNNAAKPGKKTKPASSYNDTIMISSPAAVFYSPDSLQLQKIKSTTESQVFEGTMHECFYQMRNSRMVLKKDYPAVRIIEMKNARYLLFKKSNNENELIDLDKKNDPCGIFIFDAMHSPRLVDMTNIETELGFYFSQSETR